MTKDNPRAVFYVTGIVAILVLAIVFSTLFVDTLTPTVKFKHGRGIIEALEFRENFQFMNLLLTTMNGILLIYLLYNYVSIYLRLHSNFSLGLIIIASALLAHSISANPLIAQLFGFRGSGLGPFTIIPSFFTLIAALVLIYLSRQ